MADDDGDQLLVAAAVGTEAGFDVREIVLGARLPEGGAGIGGDGEIADAIRRVLVDRGGFGAGVDLFNPVEGGQRVAGAIKLGGRGVDPGERAKGTVMDDVGIGDGEDDAEVVDAGGGEDVFELVDARGAVGGLLGVHAMVGGNADDEAAVEELAE